MLGMPQQNSRFLPAFQSLNSQAEGKVVCINMTPSDIQRSRYESRIDFIKSGKQMVQQPLSQFNQPLQNQPLFSMQNQQPSSTAPGQSLLQQQPSSLGLFGQQQNPLFGGQQSNSMTQPTQFNPLSAQPPQAQSQLFGSLNQPQTQTAPLFGGLQAQQPQGIQSQSQQNLFQQPQSSLFAPNQQQLPQQQQQQQYQYQQAPLLMSASQLPQPPQGYKYELVPDYPVDDALQQQHLEQIEQNLFTAGYPLIYGYNQQGIDFSSKQKKQKLPRFSSQIMQQQQAQSAQKIQQRNILNTRSQIQYQQFQNYKNQSRFLGQKSFIQDKIVQDQQIAFRMSQQLQVQDQKGFTLICPQSKPPIRQYIKFIDLGIDPEDLSEITVQDLLLAIQAQILDLNDDELLYQILFSQNGGKQDQVCLANELLLENLDLQKKSTLTLIPRYTNDSSLSRSSIQSKPIEVFQKKKINPNKPQIIKNDALQTIPSIEDLQYFNDFELSQVQDFQVQSKFGSIKFLKPVDLRGLILDNIIEFCQDGIEFYPETTTPEPGKEINQPCQITFYNFGQGDFKELKQKDFHEYVDCVKQQVQQMNMKLILIDHKNLIVERNSI